MHFHTTQTLHCQGCFFFFFHPHQHLLRISGERWAWNYLAANPSLCLICCRHLQIDGAAWIPEGEIWSAWQIKSLQKCGRTWFQEHNVGPKLELKCLSSQGVPEHRSGCLEGPLRASWAKQCGNPNQVSSFSSSAFFFLFFFLLQSLILISRHNFLFGSALTSFFPWAPYMNLLSGALHSYCTLLHTPACPIRKHSSNSTPTRQRNCR